MNEILQKLVDTAPIYQSIFYQDMAIFVSDMEQYICVLETDTLKLPFKIGERIDGPEYGGILKEIKRTRKSYINYIPREVTGNIPIKGVIAPVVDKNEIVGLCAIFINIDKQDKIESTSELLTESIEDASTSIKSIALAANDLDSRMKSIESNIKEAEEGLKVGTNSIGLIQGIAKQSGLLGLNAAIEAAKSGENGKGFSVVASEMRKLATESKDTAEQVVAALNKIEQSVNSVLKDIKTAREIAKTQSNSTNNMSDNMKLITTKAEDLVGLSKE